MNRPEFVAVPLDSTDSTEVPGWRWAPSPHDQTTTQDRSEKGICFLSFDGGGPGTISQLRMVDELMKRISYKLDIDGDIRPADYFDLMGGVGFGGFAALLLGRLRMTPNEAMEELHTIASFTFTKKVDNSTSSLSQGGLYMRIFQAMGGMGFHRLETLLNVHRVGAAQLLLGCLDTVVTRSVERVHRIGPSSKDLSSGVAMLLIGCLVFVTTWALKWLFEVVGPISLEGPQRTSMTRLRECLASMLRRHGHPIDIKLYDGTKQKCKVVVFAATTEIVTHCQPFRTYRSPHRSPNCTFIDAACAIMAIPELFPPVAIGLQSMEQTFQGVPHGYNNPMRAVFQEARVIFGDEKKVSLVLSLGSGQRPVISMSPPDAGRKPDQHTTTMARFARGDSDTVANELAHQLPGVYLRLNVDKGMEHIQLLDWDALGSILSHTDNYLAMSIITAHIDEASKWLLQRKGSATLGELNGTSSRTTVKFQWTELCDQLATEFKQMRDVMQPFIEHITLVDAIGNRVRIPMNFCRTFTLLSGIIQLYFDDQQPPGTRLVKRGQYQLISGTEKGLVEPSRWPNIVVPGLTVEMSMIRHDRDRRSMSCPRCGVISGGGKAEWVICSSCQAQFQITDKITDDELVSPAVAQSQNDSQPTELESRSGVDEEGKPEEAEEPNETHKTRETESVDELNGADKVDKPPGPERADKPRKPKEAGKLGEQERAEEVNEWMKFRLISVINLLLPPQNIDNAISALQQAVELMPDGHPNSDNDDFDKSKRKSGTTELVHSPSQTPTAGGIGGGPPALSPRGGDHFTPYSGTATSLNRNAARESGTPSPDLQLRNLEAEIGAIENARRDAARETVLQLFPAVDNEVIDMVLEANGEDLARAIDALLEMTTRS